jgi:hypothetical protein
MSTNTFKEQQEETRLFWQAIANKTNSLVKLSFAIYSEGNHVLEWIFLNKNQPLHPKDAFQLFKKENAWYKNQRKGKSVLWKFAENQVYNIAIVDDLQDVKQFKNKDHFLLWQTSEGKYQAAFLLDRYLDNEEVKKIQRTLIKVYGGDKASLGATHNTKVPGFFNTKYLSSPPYIRLLHVGKNVLPTKQVLQYYEKNIEPKEYKPSKDLKSLPKLMTYKELEKRKKDWWHFYNLKGNRSDADFAYALYLMHFNLNDEEIKQILLTESQDIENRKKGHLQDYLDRTVSKARIHFKPFEE